MTNYRAILEYHYKGNTTTQVARICECSRTTVLKTIKRAKECGLTQSSVAGMNDFKLLCKLYPNRVQRAEYTYPDFEAIIKDKKKRKLTKYVAWRRYYKRTIAAGGKPYKKSQFFKLYKTFYSRSSLRFKNNKHTGFCVEYDFSKLKSIEAKSMLFPVIYSKNRAVLPLGLFDFSDIKNVKLMENSLPIPEIVEVLLIKSEVWQYEEEWRIICFLKNLNEQKLVENMISKVYLGANINEENEKLISELAKAKEVPVEKFKVSPETFELKIQIDG